MERKFGIILSTNLVFNLQFVAVPLPGFYNTVASVLNNQIYRLLSIINSLVLLFLFMLPKFILKPFMSL